MALMTWEIVCLVLALVGVCAVSIYMIFKCWRSMSALNKEAQKQNTQSAQNRGRKPDLNVTQVYGVPYRPPTPPAPLPLDPARLEALVMGRRSDLHPKYLEYNDGLGDISQNRLGDSLDQQVSWRGDSALLDTEFVPSMTESPMIAGHSYNSEAMNNSPKPRKMVHISYNRGSDGAPEITNITTSVIHLDAFDVDSPKSTDEITNSTPKTPPHEEDYTRTDGDSEAQHQRICIKAPRGRWIAFDEDVPSIVIHDENGFVHQRLEFDA